MCWREIISLIRPISLIGLINLIGLILLAIMSYKELKTYQGAVIIYDFTIEFVKKYQSYWSNWTYKPYEQPKP
ncbi:MAG: hypothetical protein ACK4FL_03720 [Microgenomates group bacterium]